MRGENQLRIAIVTSGYFPVPPTRGGAVETLVQSIVDQNEESRRIELIVFSAFDEKAAKQAESFGRTKFKFVKTPIVLRAVDRLIYLFAKHVLKKQKHMSYRYILQRLHFISVVGRQLASNPVDRIVFENHPSLLMALKMSGNSERYRGRYFYHMHNVFPSFFGCRDQLLGARKILGVSNYVLRELSILSEGAIESRRMQVLRNRVDEKIFTGIRNQGVDRELREKYSIPKDAKIVLFSGRLNPEKGALEVIEAWARVHTQNAVLLIVGSYYYGSSMKSDYEKTLESAARFVGSDVRFTGFVAHDEMPRLYAFADAVVAPSIWNDPAPLVVIETVTSGRPLVTTKMGGIIEYAVDGQSAIVLPVDEALVENLAEAIDSLLSGSVRLPGVDRSELTIASFYDDFVDQVMA